MGVVRHILTDRGACLDPGTDIRAGIIPPSTSHNVLDDIVHGEGFA